MGALALLTSLTYFYAGFRKKGLGYFKRYLEPTPILLPINILEDFTKPLSLSFRLFGNVLADELTISVFIISTFVCSITNYGIRNIRGFSTSANFFNISGSLYSRS